MRVAGGIAAVSLLMSSCGATPPRRSPADRPRAVHVVAHPDDDLLFLNPLVDEALAAGAGVTTIVVTAGDAGQGEAYLRAREAGLVAAYGAMVGHPLPPVVDGPEGGGVSSSSDAAVRLVFLRLPDGAPAGEGFPATGGGSLAKLLDGRAPTLSPVLGGPALSAAGLVARLAAAIDDACQPGCLLRTLSPGPAPFDLRGDHSDHQATARLTGMAAGGRAVAHFEGYVLDRDAPLPAASATRKRWIFLHYAEADREICKASPCVLPSFYERWLARAPIPAQ